MRAALAILALLAMFLPCVAEAHPHIWISQFVRLVSKGGLITHVELEWRFDPTSSEAEIPLIDENKDGRFSTTEVSLLGKEMMPELEKVGYMTWLNTGDKDFRVPKRPVFTAHIDDPAGFTPPDWDRDAGDGDVHPVAPRTEPQRRPRNLVYILRFELPKPAKFVSVTTFDPEDFIRVEIDKASRPAGCTVGKHPTYKSEFVPGQPVFADITSCRLP
jgi:Protein of unknown function (DUF1007)